MKQLPSVSVIIKLDALGHVSEVLSAIEALATSRVGSSFKVKICPAAVRPVRRARRGQALVCMPYSAAYKQSVCFVFCIRNSMRIAYATADTVVA